MKRKILAVILALITFAMSACQIRVGAPKKDGEVDKPVSDTSAGADGGTQLGKVQWELTGKLQSATGTSLNLCVDWTAVRLCGSDIARVTAHLFLSHEVISVGAFEGKFSVGDQQLDFKTDKYSYKLSKPTRDHIATAVCEVELDGKGPFEVEVSASWDFNGTYEGRVFNGIEFKGRIPIGDEYAEMKNSFLGNAQIILQEPELPEGCEVTSLAMLLNSLGFKVSHTALSDKYLPKGNLINTSFYDKNLGNPRHRGQSFGCYAPVIVKTANAFLADKGSDLRAVDLSGSDVSRLYYELSKGNLAVTWITQDFAEAYIRSDRYWIIDGERLYWKYPLHCVLLIGYNRTLRTVTLLDPHESRPVTVTMSVFERSFRQMESQAVIIE